jgi:hypothetical protein
MFLFLIIFHVILFFLAVIRDEDTDLTITHLTTSPITNHVCKYFPDLRGRYNRYCTSLTSGAGIIYSVLP